MNYHEKIKEQKNRNIARLKGQLPICCQDFLNSRNTSGSNYQTTETYAESLKIFYDFLAERKSSFRGKTPAEIKPADFQYVTLADMESFVGYLSSFSTYRREKVSNSRESKRHKLSVVRQFYRFLYKRYNIDNEEILKMKAAKLLPNIEAKTEKSNNAIVPLDADKDIAGQMSIKQREIYNILNIRDHLICYLHFRAEMTAPEIAGIDLNDVDMETGSVYIVKRKTHIQEKKKLDSEALDALKQYLTDDSRPDSRTAFEPKDPDALFISRQTHERLSSRTIHYTIQKYSKLYSKMKGEENHG